MSIKVKSTGDNLSAQSTANTKAPTGKAGACSTYSSSAAYVPKKA
jgi:hypothetical protein